MSLFKRKYYLVYLHRLKLYLVLPVTYTTAESNRSKITAFTKFNYRNMIHKHLEYGTMISTSVWVCVIQEGWVDIDCCLIYLDVA